MENGVPQHSSCRSRRLSVLRWTVSATVVAACSLAVVATHGAHASVAPVAPVTATSDRAGIGLTGRAILPGFLKGGTNYEFRLQLVNPGSTPAAFRLQVAPGNDAAYKWLKVSSQPISLAAGESRRVVHRLEVPRNAKRANHVIVVVGTIVRGGDGPSATASVSSNIIFTVGRR